MRFGRTTGAAVMSLAAVHASAAIEVVGFKVSPPWIDYEGANPFGVAAQPTITGSVTVDNSRSDGAAFVGVDYVTGSRTWTVADIDTSRSGVNYDAAGKVNDFSLVFSTYDYVFSQNTVQINDNAGNGQYCNGCVSLTTVPDAATWAMLTLGLGTVGVALRRRRDGSLVAA